jgi:hypothetical protein
VPAMCADVSPSAASCLTAAAVPAPGRSFVSWPVAPLRILDAGRVSYEGRPRGVCCWSMPGKALSIPGRA